MDISWAVIIFGAVSNVGIIEWVKKFRGVEKLKPYFNWLPLIGAIIAGLATSSFVTGGISLALWGVNTIGILSISVLGYQNIVEFVRKKINSTTMR